MAKKTTVSKKTKPSLGEVVLVFTKSSSHGYGLASPEVIAIEGVKFIQGIQVTGKEGHRMERKRTLIPFEHVASIVQFASEDELWSEPQPKHLPKPEEVRQNTVLTSHEQPRQQQPNHGFRRHKRNRHHGNHHKGNDRNENRFQDSTHPDREQQFNR